MTSHHGQATLETIICAGVLIITMTLIFSYAKSHSVHVRTQYLKFKGEMLE